MIPGARANKSVEATAALHVLATDSGGWFRGVCASPLCSAVSSHLIQMERSAGRR
jgi:hypothetical protein